MVEDQAVQARAGSFVLLPLCKIYCCIVLDAFSRLVVGWSIDSTQTTTLVLNALGMATRHRNPEGDLVIHSDRGVQFNSWAFSQKVKDVGIAPSMGALGSAYDNAMVESFMPSGGHGRSYAGALVTALMLDPRLPEARAIPPACAWPR